jgi:hypothetical protein
VNSAKENNDSKLYAYNLAVFKNIFSRSEGRGTVQYNNSWGF